MKRKFSPERLYKLLRFLAVICLASGFILFINLWTTGASTYESYVKSGDQMCNLEYPLDENTIVGFDGHKSEDSALANCQWTVLGQAAHIDDIAFNIAEIAILVPLVFFFGRLIYKYIFPKVGISKGKPS